MVDMIMKDDEYNLPCCEIAQLLAKILYINEELIRQSARKELVLYSHYCPSLLGTARPTQAQALVHCCSMEQPEGI